MSRADFLYSPPPQASSAVRSYFLKSGSLRVCWSCPALQSGHLAVHGIDVVLIGSHRYPQLLQARPALVFQ